MKKLLLILLLYSFAFVFAGCTSIEFNIEETIKPPVNNNVALYGTWKIEKFIPVEARALNTKKPGQNEKNEKYVGSQAIFDAEISSIGQEVCINPSYRIIRTSSDVFLQNKYRISDTNLGLKKQNVSVYTITADNKPFYDLIVIDAKTAYIYMDNGFLLLNKISGNVDDKIKESSYVNEGKNIENGEYTEDPLLRSGVLIGIRSSENTYSTLWIYSKNREIKTVSSRRQLMVPRVKGFWELGLADFNDEKYRIYSKPFADTRKDNAALHIDAKEELTLKKNDARILFVGNDYFGIELNSKLEVLPIDNLSAYKGVVLSDFVGNAKDLLKQYRDTYVNTLTDSKKTKLVKNLDETDFTLSRRNGRWVMKSRIYFQEPVENKMYEEFDLNLIVPQKLIQYDKMDVPWNEIKSKLPWITDAYMSPNKDIALLVSDEGLNIYTIQNKNLIGKQLVKIPLSKGDSIIMTEWAVGKYADIWGSFADGIFTHVKW